MSHILFCIESCGILLRMNRDWHKLPEKTLVMHKKFDFF